MRKKSITDLSRRERQIMDVIFKKGAATAAEVREAIPDPPGYSSVRALLRILEDKGLLKHRQQGPRYLYQPTIQRDKARTSALRHLMQTYFDNSIGQVVAALMDVSATGLSEEEYEQLNRMIESARKESEN
jgi:BlaI family transcriptional regulator, penicillinase repressor